MKTISELMPTAQEKKRELELAQLVIGAVKKVSGRDAMLVGSIAKGTCLRGDKDLDIFVMFPKSTPRKALGSEGLKIGGNVCKELGIKGEVHYAEHPYTKSVLEGYDVDIVPCYRLKPGEKIISAVDRSPLHTEYVLSKLKKNNDVRLLKYFCKRIGVYGAEISTHGFSGYLCELLVINYNGFQEALEAASKWGFGTRIDIEGKSSAKFREPLVVVDPVDPDRNVAAAVSEERLCTFIALARQYLKARRIPGRARIMKGRGKVFVIEWALGKKEVEEIIWSQVEKFESKLVRQLDFNELHCIDAMHWTDSESKAQILVELEVWGMPPVNDHWGPRVYDKQHAENFMKCYDKVCVRGNRLVTEKKREYPTAKGLIKDMLKEVPTHLKGRKAVIKEGNAARSTEVWKLYERKFWKVGK